MISKEEAFIIRIYNKEGMYLEDFQEVEEHMGGGFCFDYTDNKEGARTFTKKELKHIEDVLIDEKYSILRLNTPTPLDSEVEEIFKKIKFSLQCIDTNGTARDSALNEIKKLEQYITPTPLDSKVVETIRNELVRAVEYAHITQKDLDWFDNITSSLNSKVIKEITKATDVLEKHEFIKNDKLDSEVEKAIKGLESMADWYVDANDYRDKFAQERLEKYITTIRQALQSYQSQLNQVREMLKYPYRFEYRFTKGFIITLFKQEVYLSNRFAKEFDNEKEARATVMMEFAQQILGDDTNE